MKHLRKIFENFQKNNIFINSIKFFLIYFSIRLLKQKMNSLNLTINENKLRVINKLAFSKILRQFKHYLGLTNWMEKYVKKYVKLIKSLQVRKTSMLKKFSSSNNVKRFYFFKINLVEPILKKRKFFHTL